MSHCTESRVKEDGAEQQIGAAMAEMRTVVVKRKLSLKTKLSISNPVDI